MKETRLPNTSFTVERLCDGDLHAIGWGAISISDPISTNSLGM